MYCVLLIKDSIHVGLLHSLFSAGDVASIFFRSGIGIPKRHQPFHNGKQLIIKASLILHKMIALKVFYMQTPKPTAQFPSDFKGVIFGSYFYLLCTA